MKLECVLFWYVCLFNQNTEETGVTSYKAATRNLTEKLTPEMRQSRFTVRGIEVSGKIKATVSNKAAANEVAQSLVSLGFTTLERDDIALALDEKALAQSGMTTGKDRIAESSQNPDILISGTLTGESPQKMRLILKAISLRNMQILAVSEGHVSQTAADWQDKIHDGWHFALHGGIGYNFVSASPIDTLENVSLRGFGPFFVNYSQINLRNLEVVFPTTQGNIRDDNFTMRNWNIGIAISLSYS